MRYTTLVSEQKLIDSLFLKISSISGDTEFSSHWARYLCVVVYGHIENSMREIFFNYASKQSSPEVSNFVRERLRGVWNWNAEKIFETVGLFDPQLKVELESEIDQELKDGLNSIVNNRKKISHGSSVSVSYIQAHEYYKKVIKFIDVLDIKVNP
jgi:hypothetical protein